MSGDENVEEQAARFNRQVEGWQFQIPEYKFDALTKRSEDLLAPLEEDAETETP